jgi:hypothetical protein
MNFIVIEPLVKPGGGCYMMPHVSPLGWEHINLTGEYRWTSA